MNKTRALAGAVTFVGILFFMVVVHVLGSVPILMSFNDPIAFGLDGESLLQGHSLQLFLAHGVWTNLLSIPPPSMLYAGGVVPLTILATSFIAWFLICKRGWRYYQAGLFTFVVSLIPYFVGLLALRGNTDEIRQWDWVFIQLGCLFGCLLVCISLSFASLFSKSEAKRKIKTAAPGNTKRDIRKGAAAGIAIILTFILFSYVDWKVHNRPDYRPLNALKSVITMMVTSTNDIVFLNLGEIGEDDNYLCFEPNGDGIEVIFPVYDERQVNYCDRLKKVCASLALPIREIADDEDARYTPGTNYIFIVSGTISEISDVIMQVITETFQINETDLCDYGYVDHPSLVLAE